MSNTFIRAALVCACLASAPCVLMSNDVESNRTRWNESKIDNYRLKVNVVKTGHAGPMGSVMIEVRNGQMVSTTPVANKFGGDLEKLSPYDTIPEIFELIERVAKGHPDELEVSYDPTYGYPTKVKMDPDRRSFDDEFSWEVLQFEKIN